MAELKEKYYNDIDECEVKIRKLEDDIRLLNEEIRNKEKDKKDLDT